MRTLLLCILALNVGCAQLYLDPDREHWSSDQIAKRYRERNRLPAVLVDPGPIAERKRLPVEEVPEDQPALPATQVLRDLSRINEQRLRAIFNSGIALGDYQQLLTGKPVAPQVDLVLNYRKARLDQDRLGTGPDSFDEPYVLTGIEELEVALKAISRLNDSLESYAKSLQGKDSELLKLRQEVLSISEDIKLNDPVLMASLRRIKEIAQAVQLRYDQRRDRAAPRKRAIGELSNVVPQLPLELELHVLRMEQVSGTHFRYYFNKTRK